MLNVICNGILQVINNLPLFVYQEVNEQVINCLPLFVFQQMNEQELMRQDITQLKTAVEALRSQNQRLHSLLVALTSLTGRSGEQPVVEPDLARLMWQRRCLLTPSSLPLISGAAVMAAQHLIQHDRYSGMMLVCHHLAVLYLLFSLIFLLFF